MPTYRQEIQEVVEAITASEFNVHRIVRECFDVVGKVVNLDDSPENIAEAKVELTAAAQEVLEVVLAKNPVVRNIVVPFSGYAVGPAVDFLAEYTGTLEELVDQYVLPQMRELEKTIHLASVDLAG